MDSFGRLLRIYRRQSRDPLKGGPLTQERLGELIGVELGDNGYSGAAISDWERDKSKINAADRLVLVSLLKVLADLDGLNDVDEAEKLLHAGHYRGLDATELAQIFGEAPPPPLPTPVASLPVAPAPLAEISRERRRQLIILERVKKYWLEGVLEKAIPDGRPIELNCRVSLESVATTYDTLRQDTPEDDVSLSAANLLHWFNEANRHLLILGAPGSGKTITLLSLAEALLARAQQDETMAIPIVLHLSSWATEQEPLAEWLISELAAKYHIPAKIGREWLENDQLLLLLDGFDRVPAPIRSKCALAINQFRQDYGFVDLVVCSRLLEYQEARVKLDLGGAVELLPLQGEQIADYISVLDQDEPTNETLLVNESLHELLQSPLLLRLLHTVQGRIAAGELAGAGRGRVKGLIQAYLDHILEGEAGDSPYPPAETRRLLSWLAQNMSGHNQSLFQLDHLQPSWLSSRRWRWLYLLITRLWDGVVIAFVLWFLLQQYRNVTPNIPTEPTELVSGLLGLPMMWTELIILVIGNLGLSLLMAIVHAIQFRAEEKIVQPRRSRQRHRQRARQVVVVGLAVGLVTTLTMLAIAQPFLALTWGVIEGVVFMIFARYIHGHSYATEVRTVTALNWSWPNAAKGMLFGILAAAFTEFIEYNYLADNGFWQPVVMYAAAGILLGGLNGYRIEQRVRTNQGSWQAIYNAFLAVAITAPTLGLLAFIIWGPLSGFLTALVMVFSSMALFGGSNLVKHLIIRGLLWLDIRTPLNFSAFLDYGANIVILRKVGGGYIFIHDLFLEQLASGGSAGQ